MPDVARVFADLLHLAGAEVIVIDIEAVGVGAPGAPGSEIAIARESSEPAGPRFQPPERVAGEADQIARLVGGQFQEPQQVLVVADVLFVDHGVGHWVIRRRSS